MQQERISLNIDNNYIKSCELFFSGFLKVIKLKKYENQQKPITIMKDFLNQLQKDPKLLDGCDFFIRGLLLEKFF